MDGGREGGKEDGGREGGRVQGNIKRGYYVVQSIWLAGWVPSPKIFVKDIQVY